MAGTDKVAYPCHNYELRLRITNYESTSLLRIAIMNYELRIGNAVWRAGRRCDVDVDVDVTWR